MTKVQRSSLTPATKITKYMCDQQTYHIYEGISIVSFAPPEEAGPFVNRVLAAMAILKAGDPRRYRRVLRLRYLVDSWGPTKFTLGFYSPELRQCTVDIEKLDTMADEAWRTPEFLAMILVHEATHCYLIDRLGACAHSTDIDTTLRIEAICYREQARFMGRIGWEASEEFDEEYYRNNAKRSRLEKVIEGCDVFSERIDEGTGKSVITGVGRVLRSVQSVRNRLASTDAG